jgi:hypothetical protein
MAINYGLIGRNAEGQWTFISRGPRAADSSLIDLLDDLGKKGWRIVATGEFGGNPNKDEIVLAKETRKR